MIASILTVLGAGAGADSPHRGLCSCSHSQRHARCGHEPPLGAASTRGRRRRASQRPPPQAAAAGGNRRRQPAQPPPQAAVGGAAAGAVHAPPLQAGRVDPGACVRGRAWRTVAFIFWASPINSGAMHGCLLAGGFFLFIMSGSRFWA